MQQEGPQEVLAHQLLLGTFKNCLLHCLLGRVGRRAGGRAALILFLGFVWGIFVSAVTVFERW